MDSPPTALGLSDDSITGREISTYLPCSTAGGPGRVPAMMPPGDSRARPHLRLGRGLGLGLGR